MSAELDRLVARYSALVERNIRGGLLDREVDANLDEQERVERVLRDVAAAEGLVPSYHVTRPWVRFTEGGTVKTRAAATEDDE